MASPAKRKLKASDSPPSAPTAKARTGESGRDQASGKHISNEMREQVSTPTKGAGVSPNQQENVASSPIQNMVLPHEPFDAAFSQFRAWVDNALENPDSDWRRQRALRELNRIFAPQFEAALAAIPDWLIAQLINRCRVLVDEEDGEWILPKFLSERIQGALPTEWRAKVTRENNAMFAPGGIMYGLEVHAKLNAEGAFERRVRISPSLRELVVPAASVLNESIEVGQWYPSQLAAYFNGAHGSPLKNVSGTVGDGATSIVVTPTSTSREVDEGNRLSFWLSEQSESNAVLRTSQRLGRPFRLLRNRHRGGPRADFAPSVGIRYDGLYKVTAVLLVNYVLIRYQLQRVEGQTPLDEVMAARPSADEVRQFREYRTAFDQVTEY